MTASFYLFDVDHGQCAALKLPDGKWCVFDAGCTASFSPISWIASRHLQVTPRTALGRALAIPQPIAGVNSLLGGMGQPRANGLLGLAAAAPQPFSIYKATISHFHGDHIDDYENLFRYSPAFMKTVANFDQQYMVDCYSTCSDKSLPKVHAFVSRYTTTFEGSHFPDYAGVTIRELSLPADVARSIGGSANCRVNNASVVTRIEAYGYSILLCGDMEQNAWDAIISDNGNYGPVWRSFLSNVNVLVAPHHGHSSGFSTKLLELAQPELALASVVAKDDNVDSRYSGSHVKGARIGDTSYSLITTRQKQHIKINITPTSNALGPTSWQAHWSFGAAALN